MDDLLENNIPNIRKHDFYRESADRIWEMAKEYEALGLKDLALVLNNIAMEIHNLARAKRAEKILDRNIDESVERGKE